MASFIVYVRNNKIENINKWLSNPDYINDSFTQEDVKIYIEEHNHEFVRMIVTYHEFVLLKDFIESKTQTGSKDIINRKAILAEYLKRIGAEPSKIFSIDSSAIDEVLQISIDIIEETYSVKEIC